MKFELDIDRRNLSDETLLNDLAEVAGRLRTKVPDRRSVHGARPVQCLYPDSAVSRVATGTGQSWLGSGSPQRRGRPSGRSGRPSRCRRSSWQINYNHRRVLPAWQVQRRSVAPRLWLLERRTGGGWPRTFETALDSDGGVIREPRDDVAYSRAPTQVRRGREAAFGFQHRCL